MDGSSASPFLFHPARVFTLRQGGGEWHAFTHPFELSRKGKVIMSSIELRGQFVWHDLLTTDTAGASAFYPRVAGWKSQPWEKDSSYTLWMNRAGPLGGAMRLPEDANAPPSHWMPHIGTPDIAATVTTARNLGARVCKEPTEIPEVGAFAIIADPQGATFAVFAPKGAPKGEGGASGEGNFSWHELATTDDQAALSFYAELFGWKKGARHDMGEVGYYQLFSHGGKDIGGIYNLQPGVTTPHWLSYVRVSDVDKAAKAAKAAGGRVISGPMEVPGGDWIAQLIDPQGAAFAVHQVKQAARPAQKTVKAAAAPKAKVKVKAARKSAAAPAAKKAKPARRASARRPAAKKRTAAKNSVSARKRASSRRVAKRASSASGKTSTVRRRPAARKRVAARKQVKVTRRRLRAKKRR
jgi:predicted enzyme related to lactoylglutathione lyase